MIEHDGVIFGCAALPIPYPEAHRGGGGADRLAQVQNQGDGERMLKRISNASRTDGARGIFVLLRTMHWFIRPRIPAGGRRLAAGGASLLNYDWDRRSQVLLKRWL